MPEALEIDELRRVGSSELMSPGRLWAAVYAAAGVPQASPHPASAMAVINGWTFISSILPWRGSGGEPPWVGVDHASRTRAALDDLLPVLTGRPLVWGGDWNNALTGRECAGSAAGRAALQHELEALRLHVPTEHLAHRSAGFSIDHIAVPLPVKKAYVVGATLLSDHDAYVVELDLPVLERVDAVMDRDLPGYAEALERLGQ